MKEMKQVHANVIINGLSQNLYLMGKIIGFCAVSAHGSMDYAVTVFAKTENPDGFLWNTMIRGLVRTNRADETVKYYKKMQENGGIADNFTFSFLLKICGQLGSVKLGKQMHCSVLKHGLENHVHVSNTLIHMYGMLRVISTAKELFDEMPEPGIVAWNTVIDCHVYCGKYKEALELFLKMYGSGIAFDEATLVVVLSACSSLSVLGFGKLVHSLADNAGFNGLVLVCNSLIDMPVELYDGREEIDARQGNSETKAWKQFCWAPPRLKPGPRAYSKTRKRNWPRLVFFRDLTVHIPHI
ncbi:unnamed protein product [Fraxinus pennsylvanica]|uniref:Pentatricopeptide repeat-containing protein n=1 Tax=Fraxinus pennsylvanica TaxID=56036 RepID=A0AAD1YUL0_9LAMI|nr:unnamed protein product [Fraxinus pennsylvanica]